MALTLLKEGLKFVSMEHGALSVITDLIQMMLKSYATNSPCLMMVCYILTLVYIHDQSCYEFIYSLPRINVVEWLTIWIW